MLGVPGAHVWQATQVDPEDPSGAHATRPAARFHGLHQRVSYTHGCQEALKHGMKRTCNPPLPAASLEVSHSRENVPKAGDGTLRAKGVRNEETLVWSLN